MEGWTTKLFVNDLYDAYDAGHLAIHELAMRVVHRLSSNPFVIDPELQEVIAELEQVGEPVEFNTAMNKLCDYADIDHRIWVQRRASPEQRSN